MSRDRTVRWRSSVAAPVMRGLSSVGMRPAHRSKKAARTPPTTAAADLPYGARIMSKEPKSPNLQNDTPRDKPMGERTEHANLDRPGAQAHPQARGWNRTDSVIAWRVR